MFIRGLLPENVLSVLHQLSSFPPRILSVLQLSKNIRALISLLCGCVCKNVLRRVFFCIRQHLFVGACPCKYRRLPISVCQHALIQYSNAPMVLLHLGNIKSFSITASPTAPAYTDWELSLIIRRGKLLFCPAEWTRSVTLPHYKAWYLMHRCHGRQWRTGGTFELTSRWWNAMLSKTTRCLWDTIHERGWMERGWERAVRSAKVTEKGDRKTGRIHRIYIFLSGRLWEKMTA